MIGVVEISRIAIAKVACSIPSKSRDQYLVEVEVERDDYSMGHVVAPRDADETFRA